MILTIATIYTILAMLFLMGYALVNRKVLTQEEIEEIYMEAYNNTHGIKLYVGNDGKLIELDEMEQKISE